MGDLKRIAIIGANSSITLLIEKAKELGYETHVFAWSCGDPGEGAADYFYPISISDKERILRICKDIGICGIASITSDYAFETVNYIARSLGLPSNKECTELVARNKYEMRKALQGCGAYEPFFFLAGSNEEIPHVESFPVIVKPTDRWSSKGITRVDSVEDLHAALTRACNESFNGMAIVEEFISGPEYSAEFICQDANRTMLAITEKQTTGAPRFIESAHYQPARLDKCSYDRIYSVLDNALAALGIENGAAHAEFRLMEDGKIAIMEIGARMGGDCIGTYLTPISTGYDYIRMVIDVACNVPLRFDIRSVGRPVSVHFIMEERDMDDYYRIKEMSPERIVEEGDFDCNYEIDVVDSSTRHGYYVLLEQTNV